MNSPLVGFYPHQLRQLWKLLGAGAWQPLLAIHLCFLLGSAVVFTPLTSLLIQLMVSLSGQQALSDTEIASFLLSPTGAVMGVLLASLLLFFAVMEYAAMLVSVHAVQLGQKASLVTSLARLIVCGPALLRLAMRIIVRCIAVAVPFVGLIGLDYWFLLTDNDINYYLAESPPEFIGAVVIAGVILVVLGAVLIRILVSWFYTLPLVLFGRESSKQAKLISEKATRGHRKSITIWLALWLFGTPLMNFVLNAPVSYLANWLVPQLSDQLPLLALVLGGSVLVGSVITFAVGFVSLVLLAHQNIRMFSQSGLDPMTEQVDDKVTGNQRMFRIPMGEKLLLVLGVLVMLLVGLICYRWIDQIEMRDDALIIAHRGASMVAPENTMAAIQQAVDDGADWIEIDVQETADGKVVVFHDSDFKRVGGKSMTISDAQSAQLPGIDIGSWFDPKFAKETTPSLQAVLELCKDRAGVLIELKYYGHDQQLEQRVVDIVEQAGMVDQVMVMSLSYPAVQKVRAMRPKWKVGLLSTVALGDITKLDVDFLGLNSRVATKRLINRAHQQDIEIYVWTVNDPIDISTMTSRGVDGLITDAPAVAQKVLQQRQELLPSERLMLELAHIFGKRDPISEQ